MTTQTEIIARYTINGASRKRSADIESLYPEFYRAALEAEKQADVDQNMAFTSWWLCPSWQKVRRAELWRAKLAADERYADCRSAVNTLFAHWMHLLGQTDRECECTPDSTCAGCKARARLADPDYAPSISELLKEG